MRPLVRAFVIRSPWIVFTILALLYLAQVGREMAESASWSEVVVNVVLAVVIVGTAALLLAIVDMQRRHGSITPRLQRLLFWVPRAVALLFVALMAVLAADAFDHGYAPGELLLALLLHLVPALVLLTAVLLAWRWEWVGAAVFAGWALFWALMTRGTSPVTVDVLIIGFPLLVAALFLLGWRNRAEVRGRRAGGAGGG